MKKRLYVAYGSNLNKRQMSYRCPTAKLVGTGLIRDFELQFKGLSSCAFATIAPKPGESVPVAVWEIKSKDERSLDLYEGYPRHYFKQTVPVEMDGGTVKAMVYVMNLDAKFGVPSAQYYGVVREGYQDCGLDESMLNRAVTMSLERAADEPRQSFRLRDSYHRSSRRAYEIPSDETWEENFPSESEDSQLRL